MLQVHRVVKTHDGRFLTPKMLLLEVRAHILQYPSTYDQNNPGLKVGYPEKEFMCIGAWCRQVVTGFAASAPPHEVGLGDLGEFLIPEAEGILILWLFTSNFSCAPEEIQQLFSATHILRPYLRDEQLQSIRADIAAKAIDAFIAEQGYTE